MPSRRDFLKGAGAAGLFAALPGIARAQSSTPPPAKARNLIFLVSDGMSQGTLAAAHHYLELSENRSSAWMQLYRDGIGVRALMETSSASDLVTDSAAAGSSWGCGQRIRNGSINVAADGKALTPLYTFARLQGKATGLVTTTSLTDATPATMVANVPHRSMGDQIAEQYLSREVDVLLGGGHDAFLPGKRSDMRDLYAQFADAGYSVIRNRSELEALPADTGKILGTFSNSHMPFSVDLAHDADLREVTPTLSEMMERALTALAKKDAGFLLQVEGGMVDKAAHSNDPAGLLFDQLEFDRCVALARKFAEENGETLVIVTTDHGCGGFNVNGYGKNGGERLLKMGTIKQSNQRFANLLPAGISPDEFAQSVREQLAVELSDDQAAAILASLREGEPNGMWRALGQLLNPLRFEEHAISWGGQQHTAELVELAAFGPGSQNLKPFIENWELHHLIREALGI